ncbi:hypothetical protein AMATHDRAFT_60994 [Amanita thiersii Skay4041]|uniref:Major facilitator superfamily (MFS) profile domain-containing protein n=1 Tax=Amanita thiersii Skay4041 TaxID=703135 RepID=A0A2A9NMA6_9AGAR|nr:hypothetical protein AMATHDRAFT_60994 [Amanita thiersii Skay4041]
MSLGAGTVVDLFYMHQRGKAMGIFTLMLTNGAHLAPIVGGYVARDRGWRWCFWVASMLNGITFLLCLVLLPETLYDRSAVMAHEEEEASRTKTPESGCESDKLQEQPKFTLAVYIQRLRFWETGYAYRNIIPNHHHRKLHLQEFVIEPLSMLKYPSVAFPALYYAVTYGYASIEPALTLATLFTEIYGFNTVKNGLANGLSLLIGASLGELCSGPVTDGMMRRARQRAYEAKEMQQAIIEKIESDVNNETTSPESGETKIPAEVRLQGIWTGAITVPAGLLMYGLTIHFETTFIAPCIGMAVACFGIQIVTSVCYTYSCSDCYRSRSNDVSLCFHVLRQVFGLPLGFYSIPFGREIGFEFSFLVFAAICVAAFLPIVALMFRGERWRKRLGEPKNL